MNRSRFALLLLAAAFNANATPAEAATVSTHSAYEAPPAIAVDTRTARAMRHALGQRALFVDVDLQPETQALAVAVNADANVPFFSSHAPDGGDYNFGFLTAVDQALVAKHLGHSDPVFLVGGSSETRHLAAELMREHGYRFVFVTVGGSTGYAAAKP